MNDLIHLAIYIYSYQWLAGPIRLALFAFLAVSVWLYSAHACSRAPKPRRNP